MSLGLAARFAGRELRGGLRQFRIFLACLALGVAAIAAVGSVRSSIKAGLAAEGAVLLGGDAELKFTYRFATPDERAWMADAGLAASEIVDFRSMAVVEHQTGAERGLTQIKAVDDLYPLRGTVRLEPDMPLAQALDGRDGVPGAVMERVLVDRLGLEVGDVLRFGTQQFVLSAVLAHEPDSVSAGFGLGPRTILRTKALGNSGLLAPGTLFSTRYRLSLADDADLDALETDAKSTFPNSGLRWRDARNGTPGVSEFVERLGAFLILVGLSGLAVGGVGVSAAVWAYLAGKTSVIATLRTLGATRETIFQTYFLQIGALAILGIVIGLALGGLAPLIFAPFLDAILPVSARFSFYPEPLFEAAIYGLLIALIFTLWPMARTDDVHVAVLFRDALASARLFPRGLYLVAILALMILLVLLAALFSETPWLTLWTTGGIVGSLGLLTLSAIGIRAIARHSARALRGRPVWRWAVAAIGGSGEGAGPVVLSLGLGLSVLAAVGQVDGNLRNAISGQLPKVAPSYFFVDIQKDQMPGFTDRLMNDPAVRKVDSAPMLRGIITRINGHPAVDVAGDHWVLQGDRGVTYSAAKPAEARVTAGKWWPEDYSGPPLISFAAEEASELGLGIGDSLTINILGRDITGTVSSFREVDFSTAGIGFIVSMNPSALSGAPHSFISTVYAEPEAEAEILRDLANAYPNISAIRVRDAIDQVADVLSGLATATAYGAAATLLTGFLVLIGASAAGEQARTYEAAVLKTLGATRRRILASFALRAGLLGAAAGSVALIAGIAGGWAVSRFILEMDFTVIWSSVLAIIGGGILATLLADLGFAWRPLAACPAQVLRARE